MRYPETETFIDNFEESEPEFTHLDAMDVIEKELVRSKGIEILPHVQLILAIMHSGAQEQDADYFAGKSFDYHCYLLGLDSQEILEMIVRKSLIAPKKTTNYNYKTVRQDTDNIRELYNSGEMCQKDLAELYNVSVQTIRKVLSNNYEPNTCFNGKQESIINDYMDGASVEDLSETYGLSDTSIYRALKDVKKRGHNS